MHEMFKSSFTGAESMNFSIRPSKNETSLKLKHDMRHQATMIASTVTRDRALLMGVKFLMMMWCSFVGKVSSSSSLGVNGECDQVKKREALELEECSWLCLPTDVVELILPKLRYEDQTKLACVCKTWRDIVKMSVPIYPAGKYPLLIHLKSRGGGGKGAILHFYNPLSNKEAFQLVSPLDLRGCEIISAKEGALLIYNQDEKQMWMVDPLFGYLTRFANITRNISFNGAAVGLHGNSYVIFLIDTSHENELTVHLYKKTGWIVDMVFDVGDKPFHLSSNPVYCDGRFYCLGSKGDTLGIFNLLEQTWDLCHFELNKSDDIHCCYYLVNWIDTVMAVQVASNGSGINFFAFNRTMMFWRRLNNLYGRSLFLGSILSAVSLPTAKKIQNRVFLPHSHQDDPKPVIVADQVLWQDQFYFHFKPRSCISSKENDHTATTLCCCNNSGEEPLYLGSTQNEKYCTIWYQPFYKGLIDVSV